MNAPASVVWVLPDKLGGVAVNVADVLAHRASRGPAHHVVLTDNRLSHDVRFDDRMRVDGLHRVQYTLPSENLHAVLRRLARAVPPGPGVLVANDWLELAMLFTPYTSFFGIGMTSHLNVDLRNSGTFQRPLL